MTQPGFHRGNGRAQFFYKFENEHGTWTIKPTPSGYWEIAHDGEGLGQYSWVLGALEDLVTGASFWPADLDPSECNLPDELGEWEAIPIYHR